jgi:hypothetical protein
MLKIKIHFLVFISCSFLLILPACNSSQQNIPNLETIESKNNVDELRSTNEFYSLEDEKIDEFDDAKADPEIPMEDAAPFVSSESYEDPEKKQEYYERLLISESQKFVGVETAQSIVNQLGFIDGISESVSNACGPLSIAILRDAGLISDCVCLHDIWLLNLRGQDSQLEVLEQNYFPPQQYEYVWVNESVRTYDFGAKPLAPGDWMFLFTAGNGFDHMLTVTKVDENGAAYTVTNIDRGDGFIISEELLYDPTQPGDGLFFELTDNARKNLGKTGTQGFLLVRRKGGFETIPLFNKDQDIDLRDSTFWRIYIREIDSSIVLYESLPNQPFHPASMIKAPIGLVALKILEDDGFQISDFSDKGYGGRTFDQLFYAMIVQSEEEATEVLLEYIQKNGGEKAILENWGMRNTMFEPRRATALDLDRFLNGFYQKKFISPNFHDYLLTLMKEQTENDSAYLGVISEVIPGVRISNKRGLLLSPTIVSDMGIVEIEGDAYSIVISGSPKQNGTVTYEDLQKSLEDFVREFGEMLLTYKNLPGG